MYTQSLVKYFSMFCVVLLVCLPLAITQNVSAAEFIAKISEEGAILEGQYTDLSIFVKDYDPDILTSGLIEKGDVPVYAHLGALSTIPGMGIPRIQSMTIRETGTNILTGVRYFPPLLYSWDDFGYIQVRLRQVGKEADVPKSIDANLTMRIIYESDLLPGMIGGGASKTFTTKDILTTGSGVYGEVILDDLIGAGDKYSIMGNKGYLVPQRIDENTVTFALYDFNGMLISKSIYLRYGDESYPYLLVRGSMRQQDYVRLIVEKAEGFKAGGGTYEFTAFPAYYTYKAAKEKFEGELPMARTKPAGEIKPEKSLKTEAKKDSGAPGEQAPSLLPMPP